MNTSPNDAQSAQVQQPKSQGRDDAPLSPLGQAALRWAALGYHVFPCVPRGKSPIVGHGVHEATTDEATIRAWWTKWPTANVAISTNGLILIDVDGAGNPWLSTEPDLAAQLMAGPVTRTPRGGRHHWFKQPAGKSWGSTVSKIAPKVDTRGRVGYVVVPPSEGEDGKPYFFPGGMEVEVGPGDLPEPPAWLADILDSGGAVRKLTATGANTIPPGVRNATLASLAGTMRRTGMTATEILPAINAVNRERCQPPVPDGEVARIVGSISRYEPDQVTVAVVENWAAQDVAAHAPLDFKEIRLRGLRPRPPVIHGLLREGETMNVIAPPKTGKSWLVNDLAISVARGLPWLGFQTVQGRALIIDNELHVETSADRIPRVMLARQMPADAVDGRLHISNLRGRLTDLLSMDAYFACFEPGQYQMIVLDAFYRFLPPGTDENDNGTMARLYNYLDRIAARLCCAFVLIHHSSKGVQGFKVITDVGAGAGAQSRATDTHLILREHQEPDAVVLEAVTRSWPPPAPVGLRWQFPVWNIDNGLDPALIKGAKSKRDSKTLEDDAGTKEPEWTPHRFVKEFITAEPKLKAALLVAANEKGLSDHRAENLLGKAEATGVAFLWKMGGGRVGYATQKPPPKPDVSEEPSKRQAIEDLLHAEPSLPMAEVAKRCGVDVSYVRKIRREKGGADDAA